MKQIQILILILFISLLYIPFLLLGQERSVRFDLEDKVPLKAFGNTWFWGDVFFFHDYHIQKNVNLKTYRLLDGKLHVRAHGHFEECVQRLNEIQAEEGLLPLSGRVVIILHGFGSNAMVTRHLAQWLRQKDVYDHVFTMTYPSTGQSILDHALMLDRVVRNLPPTVSQIDFIGHSLGSIVIRRYLSGPLDLDWRVSEEQREFGTRFLPDERVGRFVMLGPPNHGAELARTVIGRDPVRRRFGGPSADELGIRWDETEKTLAVPCRPFAIIAGGRGDDQGFSRIITGDDDGIVSTEGTKLEGAVQWKQFHVGHGELLLTEEIFENILSFMETGTFLW